MPPREPPHKKPFEPEREIRRIAKEVEHEKPRGTHIMLEMSNLAVRRAMQDMPEEKIRETIGMGGHDILIRNTIGQIASEKNAPARKVILITRKLVEQIPGYLKRNPRTQSAFKRSLQRLLTELPEEIRTLESANPEERFPITADLLQVAYEIHADTMKHHMGKPAYQEYVEAFNSLFQTLKRLHDERNG